jgi:hypothetical protein
MTNQNSQHCGNRTADGVRGRAHDSAMKESRRLPDIPWKYNPPAPADAVRPKPVVVPKSK